MADPNAMPATASANAARRRGLTLEEVAYLQAHEAAQLQGPRAALAPASRSETPVTAALTAAYGSIQGRAAAPAPGPQPPVGVTLRPVSGRYRGHEGNSELELRVDVDGIEPTLMVSGDLYRGSGATLIYKGSFICRGVTLKLSEQQVEITGTGEFTFPTSFPKVVVTIPRSLSIGSPAAAAVEFRSATDAHGSSYNCTFESPYFRTVGIEQDQFKGITPFSTYNTGQLASGGEARDLTIFSAYAEAGMELQDLGSVTIVPEDEAQIDDKTSWNAAELHASMIAHFSVWADIPQWRVWLFHTNKYDNPNYLGLMFDQRGKQRQGAALFYDRVAQATPRNKRYQLFGCVHELGHCFNIAHSFEKEQMIPPEPNRRDALSYMNYPDEYADGPQEFWQQFGFGFDRPELEHLRHAFRNSVIMGGNDFLVNAALEDVELYPIIVRDNSGLQLEIVAPDSFQFGEPVNVLVRLSTTDMRGKMAHANLSPGHGYVHYAIQKPDGRVLRYQPLLTRCAAEDIVKLTKKNPSIEQRIFLGYGRGGHYFDQPGFYKVRALYHALDGSEVLSAPVTVRVRAPLNEADEEVADLLFGDDQGTLLYMLGSDAPELADGNRALETLVDRYPTHTLALFAQAVQLNNEARAFKIAKPDGTCQTRRSRYVSGESTVDYSGPTAALVVEDDTRAADTDVNAELSGTLQACAKKKQTIAAVAEQRAVAANPEAFTIADVSTPPSVPLEVTNFLASRLNMVAREFAE